MLLFGVLCNEEINSDCELENKLLVYKVEVIII